MISEIKRDASHGGPWRESSTPATNEGPVSDVSHYGTGKGTA